ncbi:MAG: 50S ribosomal protein L6 [Candidatus Micrarchaeia archaeon]
MNTVITVPANVTVSVQPNIVYVKGPKGEVGIKIKGIEVLHEDGTLKLSGSYMMVNTYVAHFKNAFKGACEGHKKVMKVLCAHFPIKIEVKGKEVHIKNFLGGKKDLTAKIVGSAQVSVKGDIIEITGPDIYDVGQTAANLSNAVRIKSKDRRVFQDGIYVVS